MQDDQANSEDRQPGQEPRAADQAEPGSTVPGQAESGQSGGPEFTQPGNHQPDRPGAGTPGPDQPDPGHGSQAAGQPEPVRPVFGPPGGAQPGYPPPSYGRPGYGHPGYGQPGYEQPGYEQTAAFGYPGGYGQPGGYLPPPSDPARRRRTLLTYLTVAVVAAAAGAGVTAYLVQGSNSVNPSVSGPQAGGNGGSQGGNFPFPGGNSGGTSGGVRNSTERAVVNAVRPGLVDISSNLEYQGSQAAATGMVISSDGLVLTNNHVIADTTQLYATVVSTGQHFTAKWLGYDSADDVAVIKLIGAHNLRTVPLGDSGTVKLGDAVVAMGNADGAGGAPPFTGSITGLNRTITASDSGAGSSETLHGMLQTDAGIVQGDSGGALANTAGKVIGMNTAAATGGFGSQNMGFAIPIDKALRIARQIISGQSSSAIRIGSTGFIGVLVPAGSARLVTSPQLQRQRQYQEDQGAAGFPVQPSSPVCLANDLNAGVPARVAPVASGALVIGELCGTPADKAGVVAGDVITAIGGQPVTSPLQLTTVMQKFSPGMSVQITWVDVHGQTHRSAVTLIMAPPK